MPKTADVSRHHLQTADGEAAGQAADDPAFVILTDAAHMPQTSLRNARRLRGLDRRGRCDFKWASFDENTACGMCYTSGTTGNPKGVVYSHRSNVLHALMALTPDAFDLSVRTPSCRWCRSSMPTAGRSYSRLRCRLQAGAAGHEARRRFGLRNCRGEKVTMTAAVPTIWLMLLATWRRTI